MTPSNQPHAHYFSSLAVFLSLSPSTEAEAYEPVGYTAARDAPVVEAGQPDDDYDGKKVPVLDEYERLP